MTSGAGVPAGHLCVYFDADSLPVVTAARDCIHHGWRLLHHPLYGNYRPYQQPYRSLLLASPVPGTAGPDVASLHLVEEALLVYTGNKVLAPADAPVSLKDGCSLLDYELMRLPLEQSGIVPEGFPSPENPEAGEELTRNCA